LLGTEHRLLVVGDLLLVAGILHAYVVADPPVVEDRPAKRRTTEAFETVALPDVGEVLGGEADVAEQREGREQVCLGDADLRALRGELALGASNVGTAAQHLGGNADRDLCVRRRNRPRVVAEDVAQVARRNAQQNAERVLGLTNRRLQHRNGRFGESQQ
jgi:hypothetical protein